MSFGERMQEPNYKITDATRKKSALAYMEIADTDFSRMRGLMFRDEIIAILFVFGYSGKFPIHSNFVKKEFDAVYLSCKEGAEGGKVVELFRKIPPKQQRISPQKDATHLLELPVEVTDRLGISEGDALTWKRIDK